MHSDYKKAIGLFGIGIPVFFLLALAAAVYWKASSIHREYEAKLNQKKMDERMRMQCISLAKQVSAHREELKNNERLLGQDRLAFLNTWKKVRRKFKANEFIAERPVWQNSSNGLGKNLEYPSSEVMMSFNATYRAMQLGILELETSFPQMQLDALSMTPSREGRTIQFKTSHTVWNKQ